MHVDWGSVAAWSSAVMATASLIVIVSNRKLTVREIARENFRKKCESTLSAGRELNALMTTAHRVINEHKQARAGAVDPDAIALNAEVHDCVYNCLDEMQYFAVGLESGVYDYGVALHMFGTWWGELTDDLKPLIEHMQRKLPDRKLFYDRVLRAQAKFAPMATMTNEGRPVRGALPTLDRSAE